MDEFDDRRELVVVGAGPGGARGGLAGQHHQHRPQALAAGRNDVLGDLVDQDHVRSQAGADQRVDRGHVGGGQGLDAGQAGMGRGNGVVSHGVARESA